MTEFDRNYYEGLMNELKEIRQKIIKYADDKVKENPTTTRKDFAFWVKENTHKMLTGFVISRYDGKEIEPFIRRNLPIRYVDFLEYKKCFE